MKSGKSDEARSESTRERRKHPRASGDWPITIVLEDGTHTARLRDVSRAGISFYLDRRISEMTVLALQVDLPGRNGDPPVRIDGRGVVVRCQPISPRVDHYEVAVFLNQLPESSREELDAYVLARGARA
jgi:hypothetical protein